MPKVTKVKSKAASAKKPVKAVKKSANSRVPAKKKAEMIPNDGIWGRIQPMTVESGIKMAIYGPSGTGKTRLWSTFPKPILAVLCSGGHKPGELRSINTPEMKKVVDQVVLKDSKELIEIAENFDKSKYQTLVVDHATGVQDLILAEILEMDYIPEQGSWGMAQQGDWQACAAQFKQLFKGLLGIKGNMVLVSHQREFEKVEENGESMAPYIGVALTPASAEWVHGSFDYVVTTQKLPKYRIKKTKVGSNTVETKEIIPNFARYVLYIGESNVFKLKFREATNGERPAFLENPTYPKLEKYLEV